MDVLKEICNSYNKWKPLEEYIVRIGSYRDTNGIVVLENCKSLIESICKTILEDLEETITNSESTQSLVSKTCNKMSCLPNTGALARSFVTVAHQLGEFRDSFSTTGHGASVYQLEERRNKITKAATDFMILTVEQLAVFLITVYQEEYPVVVKRNIRYEDNEEFNSQFDEKNESIEIGIYGPYSPSEVLFSVDIDAYKTELENNAG
ncbi:MAG: hypothetical protein WCR55_07400 [Lentisphaerota bacterium]